MSANAKLRLIPSVEARPEVTVHASDTVAAQSVECVSTILQAACPGFQLRDVVDPTNMDHETTMQRWDDNLARTGFVRTEDDVSQISQDNSTTDAITLAPCVSLAPFQSRVNENLVLLPASLSLKSALINNRNDEDRLAEKLSSFLKLKSFLGLDDITIFYDGADGVRGKQAVDCVSLCLNSLGETANRIMELQEGLAMLVASPRKFGSIITVSDRGSWVQGIAQSLTGMSGQQVIADIGHGNSFFGYSGHQGTRAPKDEVAGPSSLFLAAVMLLVEQGNSYQAARIYNAWLRSIEDGIHTQELFQFSPNARRVDAEEFAAAVIERFGDTPRKMQALAVQERGAGVPDQQQPINTLRLVT